MQILDHKIAGKGIQGPEPLINQWVALPDQTKFLENVSCSTLFFGLFNQVSSWFLLQILEIFLTTFAVHS